jgi:Ca-activated chloride channel family protein
VLVDGDAIVRMELIIGAEQRDGGPPERVATDLVVVLDRSGSMGGEKIAHAKQAVGELIRQLRPHDRFALVTYSNDATIVIPPTPAAGISPAVWMEASAAISTAGGTNMARGLDLGLDTVHRSRAPDRVPRVILLSDGLANIGDTSVEGLVARAARAARGEYMLSTVGVGADFNEYLMTGLADAGTGNYYYLETSRDLASVFAREFEAARTTVASGLAVAIEPADGVRVVDAAGYPLERTSDAVTFRPGSLFAGQERHIWVTLTVPNHARGAYALGRFSLSYADQGRTSTVSFSKIPQIACIEDPSEFLANIDRDTWTRSVLVDTSHKLQQDVARKVKEGRRDEAEELMHAFRRETAAINARLQSTAVAERLRAVDQLQDDVAEAFTGNNQGERQNHFSKAKSLDALDGRRPGSKR